MEHTFFINGWSFIRVEDNCHIIISSCNLCPKGVLACVGYGTGRLQSTKFWIFFPYKYELYSIKTLCPEGCCQLFLHKLRACFFIIINFCFYLFIYLLGVGRGKKALMWYGGMQRFRLWSKRRILKATSIHQKPHLSELQVYQAQNGGNKRLMLLPHSKLGRDKPRWLVFLFSLPEE